MWPLVLDGRLVLCNALNVGGYKQPPCKSIGKLVDPHRSARAGRAPAAGVLGGAARDPRRRARSRYASSILTDPRGRCARLANDNAAGVRAVVGRGLRR